MTQQQEQALDELDKLYTEYILFELKNSERRRERRLEKPRHGFSKCS